MKSGVTQTDLPWYRSVCACVYTYLVMSDSLQPHLRLLQLLHWQVDYLLLYHLGSPTVLYKWP